MKCSSYREHFFFLFKRFEKIFRWNNSTVKKLKEGSAVTRENLERRRRNLDEIIVPSAQHGLVGMQDTKNKKGIAIFHFRSYFKN
jgi:hypothetical protein